MAEDPSGDATSQAGETHALTPNLALLSVPAGAISQGDGHSMLFAATQALGPSPTPPDLSLPDIPFEDSSSPPYSLTPPAPNRSLSAAPQLNPDSPFIRPMLIDRDTPDTNPAQAARPTPATLPRNIPAPPVEEEDVPDFGLMHDHLIDNEEHQSTLQFANPQDPLSKYMRGDMPLVHDGHPSAPFEFITMSTITEWDSFPDYRLAACPFGYEARDHRLHNSFRKRILAAVAEITKSTTAGVTPPAPGDTIINNRYRTPHAFLIHGLTKEQYHILLRQRIWVSAEITFRVTIRVPFSPDLLFTLTEISHLSGNKVYELVQSVWQDQGTLVAIDETIQKHFPNITLDEAPDIPGFLATMRVELLEMNEEGGIPAPQYNIYANGKFFPNYEIWNKVRTVLAGRPYRSGLIGQLIAHPRLHHCTLCYGADHPTGLCPFKAIPGWKGPTGFPPGARGRRNAPRNSGQPSFHSRQENRRR